MMVVPLHEAPKRVRRVAVGTFDGVHLGHREVIAGADAVVTFDPHPVSVIAPGHQPPLLTTLARKAELVAELGAAELVVIPFDRSFAERSAREFVDLVLVETLGASHVSVGENFHFGHRALGGPGLLAADGRFETRVVPLLEVDGEIVSSSHIRGLILGGAVEYAGRLLGSRFAIDGIVEPGERRGRELGYPTANLVPRDGYCTPGHGVYACRARTSDGAWHAAAVSIGVRPMFETGLGELIEAHVVDFDGDLYGSELRIEFQRRLRGERRFSSVDELVEQIGRDVRETREIVAGA